jgi:hypothetical protein
MSLRVNILLGRRERRLESCGFHARHLRPDWCKSDFACKNIGKLFIHTYIHTYIQDMVTAGMVTVLAKPRLVILFMLVNNAYRVSITGRSTRNKSSLGSQYLTHRIRTQWLLLLYILISTASRSKTQNAVCHKPLVQKVPSRCVSRPLACDTSCCRHEVPAMALAQDPLYEVHCCWGGQRLVQ